MQQLDKIDNRIKQAAGDIEVLKIDMDTRALDSTVADIVKKFKNFAPMSYIQEIRRDQIEFMRKEDVRVMQREIDNLKKDT